MKLIERVQYKAALTVSGCWQGTSQEKLYDELGWEVVVWQKEDSSFVHVLQNIQWSCPILLIRSRP